MSIETNDIIITQKIDQWETNKFLKNFPSTRMYIRWILKPSTKKGFVGGSIFTPKFCSEKEYKEFIVNRLNNKI